LRVQGKTGAEPDTFDADKAANGAADAAADAAADRAADADCPSHDDGGWSPGALRLARRRAAGMLCGRVQGVGR